jgi:hypothetical protein
MTTRKGSLLGEEPFPLSLGVEGLASEYVQAFPTQLGMASRPKPSGLSPWADASAG